MKQIIFIVLLFTSIPFYAQLLSGTYILYPKVNPATVIDIPDAKFTNGNKLQVWEYYSASSNQHFRVKNIRQGVIQILTNYNTDISFDVPDGRMQDGNQVQIWKAYPNPIQYWNLEKVKGTFYILRCNIDPSYVLTVVGDGSNGSKVVISKYNGSDNQIWALLKQGTDVYKMHKMFYDRTRKK